MAEDTIREAVKKDSKNEADVKVVQRLLNAHIARLTPLSPLKVDGKMGERTLNAILEFQKRVVGMREPDGRVDPSGKTMFTLRNVNTEVSSGKLPIRTRLYSSIASTSATNRWLLSARNALITLKTESLKPPMFIMSARSQARSVWYGCKSM
jgi:peptidoglycan hydrolase-like protein with peptidoglycan-binding domain